MIDVDLTNMIPETVQAVSAFDLETSLKSYVETTSTIGLINADDGTALMSGFTLYCSTFPAAAPVCIPMAIGFVYQWFDQVFGHMF